MFDVDSCALLDLSYDLINLRCLVSQKFLQLSCVELYQQHLSGGLNASFQRFNFGLRQLDLHLFQFCGFFLQLFVECGVKLTEFKQFLRVAMHQIVDNEHLEFAVNYLPLGLVLASSVFRKMFHFLEEKSILQINLPCFVERNLLMETFPIEICNVIAVVQKDDRI